MVQSFAIHNHTSSIRCVASAGKYLASGGADDRIVVYDMNSRKEHCMLNHHSSTVTCVKFTVEKSHLISGSNDGVLAIVRVGNWQLEKLWEKPHKGAALIDIAIHPTGKLLLTLGSDHTLRTWNLIKGRQAYAVNLTTKSTDVKSLDSIKWTPSGVHFILSGGLHLELWSITTGGIINKYEFNSRVVCTCPLENKIIAIGHENGEITVLNIENGTQKTLQAHAMRVKCLESSDNWLVSASSDGRIKVWLFDGTTLTEKGSCTTGCRCTSLALVLPITVKEESDKNADATESEIKSVELSDESDTEKNPVKLLDESDTKVVVKKGYRVVLEEEITDQTVEEKAKKRKNKTKLKKDKKIKNK